MAITRLTSKRFENNTNIAAINETVQSLCGQRFVDMSDSHIEVTLQSESSLPDRRRSDRTTTINTLGKIVIIPSVFFLN